MLPRSNHGVPDELLHAAGQRLAASHRPSPGDRDRCCAFGCAGPYPCLGRRVADQIIRASALGWPHTWTARHDLRRYLETVTNSSARPGTRAA